MNTILYIPKFQTSGYADVTEDVSLPDYIPEVRRVVGVRACCTVDGKYMAGDALEVDGSVTYTVLYSGGDGTLAQVSQTTPYTGKLPVQDDVQPGESVVWANAEQISCRVTAPRKITLSSRVRLGAMAQNGTDTSMKCGDKGEVRRKNASVSTAFLKEVRAGGEASGEIREKEGTRVIMASAEMAVGDVRVGTPAGRITVKGDVYLNALSVSPDGGTVISRSRVPVEDTFAMPDRADPASCRAAAFGTITLIEVDAGDDGVMQWRAEYDMDCDIMETAECVIAEDAYTVGYEDELTARTADCCTPAGCVNGRLTVSGTCKLRPGTGFITAWGTVGGEKCSVKNGRLNVEGIVKLECVTAGEGDTFTDEVQIPLRYECEAFPGAADCDALSARVRAVITDVSARPDGDTLNLTAELAIGAAALGKQPVTYVDSVSRKSPLSEKKNLLRVYIPDGDESGWDVEKRFRLKEEARLEGRAYVI